MLDRWILDRMVTAVWRTVVMPNAGIRAWGEHRGAQTERLHPERVPNLLEASEGSVGAVSQGCYPPGQYENIRIKDDERTRKALNS